MKEINKTNRAAGGRDTRRERRSVKNERTTRLVEPQRLGRELRRVAAIDRERRERRLALKVARQVAQNGLECGRPLRFIAPRFEDEERRVARQRVELCLRRHRDDGGDDEDAAADAAAAAAAAEEIEGRVRERGRGRHRVGSERDTASRASWLFLEVRWQRVFFRSVFPATRVHRV